MGRCKHKCKRSGKQCKIKLDMGYCYAHDKSRKKEEERNKAFGIACAGLLNLIHIYEWANNIVIEVSDLDHIFWNAWMLGEQVRAWKNLYGEEFLDDVYTNAYESCL